MRRGRAQAVSQRGQWGKTPGSLEGEKLSRRVPRFAKFVEATEGGEGALTDAQREFLDKFSSGLAEALSEEADEADAKGAEDDGTV